MPSPPAAPARLRRTAYPARTLHLSRSDRRACSRLGLRGIRGMRTGLLRRSSLLPLARRRVAGSRCLGGARRWSLGSGHRGHRGFLRPRAGRRDPCDRKRTTREIFRRLPRHPGATAAANDGLVRPARAAAGRRTRRGQSLRATAFLRVTALRPAGQRGVFPLGGSARANRSGT